MVRIARNSSSYDTKALYRIDDHKLEPFATSKYCGSESDDTVVRSPAKSWDLRDAVPRLCGLVGPEQETENLFLVNSCSSHQFRSKSSCHKDLIARQ